MSYHLKHSAFIFLFLALIMSFPSHVYYRDVYGILTENGTCTNANVTIGNTTILLNQSYSDFIKNLTRDNQPLAELMCHIMENQGVKNYD